MSRLRAFLRGCWLQHTYVHARNLHGDLIYKCVECFEERPVLKSKIVKGPKRKPDAVMGTPITTVKTKTFTDDPKVSKIRKVAS